jgi:hypothetical protein
LRREEAAIYSFPAQRIAIFLPTTEGTPGHRGKEEIGNLGAVRE